MKLNKTLLLLMLCLITAAIAGCSSGGTGTSTEKTAQVGNATASEGEKVAFPEEKPALIGKVKEIVGNEVTICKVKLRKTRGGHRDCHIIATL